MDDVCGLTACIGSVSDGGFEGCCMIASQLRVSVLAARCVAAGCHCSRFPRSGLGRAGHRHGTQLMVQLLPGLKVVGPSSLAAARQLQQPSRVQCGAWQYAAARAWRAGQSEATVVAAGRYGA